MCIDGARKHAIESGSTLAAERKKLANLARRWSNARKPVNRRRIEGEETG